MQPAKANEEQKARKSPLVVLNVQKGEGFMRLQNAQNWLPQRQRHPRWPPAPPGEVDNFRKIQEFPQRARLLPVHCWMKS